MGVVSIRSVPQVRLEGEHMYCTTRAIETILSSNTDLLLYSKMEQTELYSAWTVGRSWEFDNMIAAKVIWGFMTGPHKFKLEEIQETWIKFKKSLT